MKKQSPVKSRSNKGVHIRGGQPTKKKQQQHLSSSSSFVTGGTCSTSKSRSRSPSPQERLIKRGMDPGGLIVIPRRKPPAAAVVPQKQAAKKADGAVVTTKEVKWNELASSAPKKQKKKQQQQQEETALVVVAPPPAMVTPPSSVLTITNGKTTSSSSDKRETNGRDASSSQGKEETALTLYNDNKSSSAGNPKSNSAAASSTAVVVGNKERAVATEEAVTTMSASRNYRAHLWSSSSSKGTQQRQRSSSRSRTKTTSTSSRNDNGGNGDGNNNSDETNKGRKKANANSSKLSRSISLSTSKSSRGNLKESNNSSGGVEEDKKNTKSGETKEKKGGAVASSTSSFDKQQQHVVVAKKEVLSKQKSTTTKLSSISGSREAIRSFSRKNGQKSNYWQGDDGDGEDGKNTSWVPPSSPGGQQNKGSYIERLDAATPVKKQSFIKKLGSKFAGKSSSTATVAESVDDDSEVGEYSEVSLNTIAAAAASPPATKNQFSSTTTRGRVRGGGSQFQQRSITTRDIHRRRRHPSLSPDRSESSQSFSDRESFYSRSRSPSHSPRRRNRRSLSPHSSRSRSSSYSGSRRSPSPSLRRRNRRSLSSHSSSRSTSSPYSGSRSPSPRQRRSMSSESRSSSQSSYASVSVSFYSRSRSPPSPSSRVARSVSPSPRYNSRSRARRFHPRSRTPSPRSKREFGGARRRRRRRSPPRVNQNRRDSFRSLSPPRRRRPNGHIPIMRQSSLNVMPRRSSLSSRSRSPQPRGLRQMSGRGNGQQNIGNPGPNRQMSSRRGISNGHNRRGSNGPPLNRSFVNHARDRRHNSDFDPRRKAAPNGDTRQRTFQRRGSLESRRPTFQRRGSLESRTARSQSPLRVQPQSQQRQIADVYKRPVSRSFAPAPAVESRALVVSDLSPSKEDIPMTSTPAQVSRVESQSLQNVQAPRRHSSSSESTGVWIDCPGQNDSCDEDLTFSECRGLRNGDSSDATYGATSGLPSPGSPSVTNSFATYTISHGPPPASGRRVDSRKFTKPGRSHHGSNQSRSKAADLVKITSSEGNWRGKNTTELTEDCEDANVRQDIARKSTGGSIPSRDKKQGPPFVPGPPPRKPPINMMSLASGTEPPRPKPSEFVRTNSWPNIEAVAAIHQEAQDDDPPSSNQPSPPPPPFLPQPNDSSVEMNQASNYLFEGQNNWPQYLPKSKRRNMSKRSGSSRTNSPEREISRGRQTSSTGRGVSNDMSLSDGRALISRAAEELVSNDCQVDDGDGIDISKVALSLQQMTSRTPTPSSSSDAVDMGKRMTLSPSHQFAPKPLHNSYQHQMHAPTMHHVPFHEQQQVNYEHQGYAPELQHPPNLEHQSAPENKDTDWTKYAVKCSARQNEDGSKKKERRKSKLSGKVPNKLSHSDNRTHLAVKNMPFTDTFGDAGIYTGQVNDNGRPDGKGSMKYNSGIFYEGTWTDGSQDEKAVTQYDRIRSGFTSWGGKGKVAVKSGQTLPWNAHKNDKYDENDKTNVRGMEWVDLNGDAGRYTGEVNNDKVPHGKGMMKFDFGLIAEGEWVYGVLKENPQDRALSAAELNARGLGAGVMSVMSSARSLGRGGGVSIGTGVSGSIGPLRPPMLGGGISVGPGISVGQGSVYGSAPQMMMQPQLPPQMMMQPPSMMMPQPNNLAMQQNGALIAQQNAMMQTMAMYGGGYPQMTLMPMQQQQNSQADPPITEIKFS